MVLEAFRKFLSPLLHAISQRFTKVQVSKEILLCKQFLLLKSKKTSRKGKCKNPLKPKTHGSLFKREKSWKRKSILLSGYLSQQNALV